ncbi:MULTISPECIES: TauD/TfdA family dioxygenase [Moorena]|uniref:Putative taurine catabolism dioxygenase n=1 Tax=Moorena producens 3L TaxID=489825 RepID=F4XMB6_9CYAN|nr:MULTISPECIES: TauD/TfdA family dioxygenase [Moorena]EGJ33825.1 putative taurine catabolism dioxygenase [Moorena producens 3L]NEP35397.1 taurine catabolism dioxygenase TauD [Moorena sp. SIO3B2]NEP67877.1 taurine catabolism dioxygenase TauD [Moorena sp. SIO3A5]OLT68991.1 taurine catabolism dioxygenase TauD [Moorena producens 3L]
MLKLDYKELIQSDRFLTLDGKRFHYIWLYDHCLCPRCYHPSSFQKINDLSDRLELPKPKSVQFQDEKLIIDWDEDPPHRSIFPRSWLLSRAYDPKPEPRLSPREKQLWDKAWLDANPPEWCEYSNGSFEFWMNQLSTLGFTLLRKMPWEKLETFVSSIGPIYYLAQYGRYSTVKAIPNGQDLSLSAAGNALSPHTDITFLPTPPIVQLLYCVENEACGGESTVVDGFRVAQDFRQDHPHYFEILTQTPVTFWQLYQDWDYYVSQTKPIIKLNDTEEVTNIFFSHKNLGLDLPFEQMESFYEAYYGFFRYLKKPAYEYCFRMQPGDCLLVQNFRILHGRKAFDASSGSRHLETAYMDWNYFAGRQNFHQVQSFYR